jgi:hypothetical protein
MCVRNVRCVFRHRTFGRRVVPALSESKWNRTVHRVCDWSSGQALGQRFVRLGVGVLLELGSGLGATFRRLWSGAHAAVPLAAPVACGEADGSALTGLAGVLGPSAAARVELGQEALDEGFAARHGQGINADGGSLFPSAITIPASMSPAMASCTRLRAMPSWSLSMLAQSTRASLPPACCSTRSAVR